MAIPPQITTFGISIALLAIPPENTGYKWSSGWYFVDASEVDPLDWSKFLMHAKRCELKDTDENRKIAMEMIERMPRHQNVVKCY